MKKILLLSVLFLGSFLYFYKVTELMPFIGDQGWFYLSARYMLLTGHIPLVGIASSHPWLHQGALWTYVLSVVLWVFKFNPVGGAYLAGVFHIAAIGFLYKLGVTFFSRRVGFIAAALYATSPLIVIAARMPYHTTPIPLCVMFFVFVLIRWIQGRLQYFPWVIFSLALLYNFELATFVFSGVVGLLFIAGLLLKQKWAKGVFNKKILFCSLLAYLVPMLPMLVYDATHNFVQTLGFIAWVGYKVLILFGLPPLHAPETIGFTTMVNFTAESYRRLMFPYNEWFAGGIFVGSFVYGIRLTRECYHKKKYFSPLSLVVFINVITVVGLFATKIPSEAYLPMLFPGIVLFTAVFFDSLFQIKRLKYILYPVIGCLIVGNTYFIISHDYAFDRSGLEFTLQKRTEAVKEIIRKSDGKAYNIKGEGEGSQFESFTMNYEYLAWWLGDPPSSKKEAKQFIITEGNNGIRVKEMNKQL